MGSATFAFSVGSITSGVAAKAHIIEFDATGTNVVGVIEKQDSNAFSVAQFRAITPLAGLLLPSSQESPPDSA